MGYFFGIYTTVRNESGEAVPGISVGECCEIEGEQEGTVEVICMTHGGQPHDRADTRENALALAEMIFLELNIPRAQEYDR